MKYAGIGSRQTPKCILLQMTEIALMLQQRGFVLRSGGAIGADTAFENGAGRLKEIFYANDATPEAMKLADKFHPAFWRCSEHAQKLHARNGMQILGKNLDDPCAFVICWTKDGKASGGTGQAIRIAEFNQIPVFNLFNNNEEGKLKHYVQTIYKHN